MDALATKLRAERNAQPAHGISLNDVLVTAIFFGTVALLTLSFIKFAA